MRKIFFILILLPIIVNGKPINNGLVKSITNFYNPYTPIVYPYFYHALLSSDVTANGYGSGYGSVTINNNQLTVSFGGAWSQAQQLKTANQILSFGFTPSLPNMELGPILVSNGIPSSTGYNMKIENNNLVIYTTGTPINLLSCYFNFTINLNCIEADGSILDASTKWYLDNDLDGLGDPANFIVQCYKPTGNYVLDNTDLCPTTYGSLANSTQLSFVSQGKNYIKNTSYKEATFNGINANDNTPITDDQKIVNITYFDGLGRPIQKIAHRQSSSGKDIVMPIEYDAFGRQTKDYLPFVSSGAASLDLKANEVMTFYSSNNQVLTGNPNFEATSNPYSDKLLEASPLNRVLKQSAPGNTWAMGSGHEVKFDYQTNEGTGVNAVKMYSATATLDAIGLTQNNFYPANTLYLNITKDENWISSSVNDNTTQEFKDKEGKVVLKRTFNAGQPHETYYVYDLFGNLTYVIPPAVTNPFDVNQMNGLCYQYKYDYRNRLVEKKLPGKQWEYIIYDKLDRVVATGPAFSPFTDTNITTGWMITKYDVFNRVVITGFMPDTNINTDRRKSIQLDRNNQSTNLSEVRNTNASTINNVIINYTNVAFPTTAYHVLTINYYDDYNYYSNVTIDFSTAIESQPVYFNNNIKPKGMPTGSWIRICESTTQTNAEKSYVLYDYKARPIRNFTTNYLGGYTQVDSKIDFMGKVLYTITTHKRISTSTLLTVRDDFTYSPQDKLVTHFHKINNEAPQLLTENTYDEMGQLISKKVGGSGVDSYLQKVDYSYNIRGWMTAINDINQLNNGTDPQDLFSFKLSYDNPENATALYNGNISETFWKTSCDLTLRKYAYTYDNLNRLLTAEYQKPNNTNSNPHSYDETLSYDKNGNITHLTRYGNLDSDTSYLPAELIDELSYTYNANSPNQLIGVTDSTINPNGFKDDANGSSLDYSYDNNGNMTKDLNKGIVNGSNQAIIYNHLNLPTKIIFGTTGTIEYLYNAAGQKVKKKVTEGATITITDYLSGFQYVNNGLEFFPHSEGYVACTMANQNSLYSYVFNYTDHLGNVRVSYGLNPSDQTLVILEENNYYPFGLKHANYNSDEKDYALDENEVLNVELASPGVNRLNKYKYNGKELQDELGLNMYDYGARNYMPDIGRWGNVDPLAEKYVSHSPYAYCLNNSMIWTDPTGMSVEPGSQNEWDKQKQAVLDKSQSINNKIDKIFAKAFKKGWSDEKISQKLGNLQDRSAYLSGTLYNLSVLENSTQVYALKSGVKEEGGTTYDSSTGNITFSFDGTANFVHETAHGGQFESGDFAFDSASGKPLGQDVTDEIAAYKAQFGYDPSSVSGLTSNSSPSSFAGITASWVQNITKSNGDKLYGVGGSANTGIAPVNVNTNLSGLIKAYPNAASSLQGFPSTFTLKDFPTIYYKK